MITENRATKTSTVRKRVFSGIQPDLGNYCPVLMAADILLYGAGLVPVGEDQKQHVELTRDIAERFNRLFGATFVVPEPLIRGSGARVMGLDDPSVKMSKSLMASRQGHAIGLLDPLDVVRRSISRAVTDSGSDTSFATASAGVRNLLEMYEVLQAMLATRSSHVSTGKATGFSNASWPTLSLRGLIPFRNAIRRSVQRPLCWRGSSRKGPSACDR